MYKLCITLQILKTSQTFVAKAGADGSNNCILWSCMKIISIVRLWLGKPWHNDDLFQIRCIHLFKRLKVTFQPGCVDAIMKIIITVSTDNNSISSMSHTPSKKKRMDSEKDYQWIKPCKNSQMKFWPLTIKPMMVDNSVTLPKFLTSWNLICSYENFILLFKVKLGSHSESYLNNR